MSNFKPPKHKNIKAQISTANGLLANKPIMPSNAIRLENFYYSFTEFGLIPKHNSFFSAMSDISRLAINHWEIFAKP